MIQIYSECFEIGGFFHIRRAHLVRKQLYYYYNSRGIFNPFSNIFNHTLLVVHMRTNVTNFSIFLHLLFTIDILNISNYYMEYTYNLILIRYRWSQRFYCLVFTKWLPSFFSNICHISTSPMKFKQLFKLLHVSYVLLHSYGLSFALS